MNLLEVFKDSEDVVEYPARTVLITEGDAGNHMYVVMQGEVDITLKHRYLATASPGDIIGEMALINSTVRSATATAKTDCRLVLIDQSSFKSLLRYVPDFSLHIMNVLTDRLQSAYDMIEE